MPTQKSLSSELAVFYPPDLLSMHAYTGSHPLPDMWVRHCFGAQHKWCDISIPTGGSQRPRTSFTKLYCQLENNPASDLPETGQLTLHLSRMKEASATRRSLDGAMT